MKKTMLLAFLAVIITAGCTKSELEDTPSSKQIGFETRIAKSTKAETPLSESTIFGVYAFYKKVSGTYDYTTPYMQNVKGYYSSGWITEGKYYWPLAGTLKFVAYSPYQSTAPTYTDTDGLTIKDYTIEGNVTEFPDLLYTADNGAEINITSSPPTPVSLVFNHALTQIYFSAVAPTSGYTFTIKKIELVDVMKKATFTGKTPSWSVSGDEADRTTYTYYENSTGQKVTDNVFEFTERVMLIPQPTVGILVKITYDVKDGQGNELSGKTKEFSLSTTWQMNQSIKYALTFTPDQITFDPKVSDWTEESTPLN